MKNYALCRPLVVIMNEGGGEARRRRRRWRRSAGQAKARVRPRSSTIEAEVREWIDMPSD